MTESSVRYPPLSQPPSICAHVSDFADAQLTSLAIYSSFSSLSFFTRFSTKNRKHSLPLFFSAKSKSQEYIVVTNVRWTPYSSVTIRFSYPSYPGIHQSHTPFHCGRLFGLRKEIISRFGLFYSLLSLIGFDQIFICVSISVFRGPTPGTYFPLRKGGRVTLYQDAHVDDGTLPSVDLDDGMQYIHGKCWEDMADAIKQAKNLIYITGWSLYHPVRLVRRNNDPTDGTLGDLLKAKAQEGVRVLVLLWDDPTSRNFLGFRTVSV